MVLELCTYEFNKYSLSVPWVAGTVLCTRKRKSLKTLSLISQCSQHSRGESTLVIQCDVVSAVMTAGAQDLWDGRQREERLSNVSRVTEFVKGGDRIQARFLWLRDMCAYLPTKICLFFF